MIDTDQPYYSPSLRYDKAVRGFAQSTDTLTNRTIYPVTLAEAKVYCRVDDSDTSQDAVLNTLIRSGVDAVENRVNVTLIDCSRRVYLSECDFANLPFSPIKSIQSVQRFESMETGYVETDQYDHFNEVLYFKQLGRYKVEYSAGISATSGNIPDIYKHALLNYVKLYFEDRFLFKDDNIWMSILMTKRKYL